MSDERVTFTILPPGTIIFPPDELFAVAIQFPTGEDAIVFIQFLQAFISGEYDLEITERQKDNS